MDYKVSLTPRAKRDLAEIWHYISQRDPAAATPFCLGLAKHAYSLQKFPMRSAELVARPRLRKLAYQSYLIFYRIDADRQRVEILRFWHGARDPRHLRLKEEPGVYVLPVQAAR